MRNWPHGIYVQSSNIIACREIGIGFSCTSISLHAMPGWEERSWGYHGDNGEIYHSRRTGQAYADCFTTGDIIGCGVDFKRSAVFFTKNGVSLGNESI